MGNRDSLLRIRYLVLNRAVIVGTAAVRASTLFAVGFDIVVAELANLEKYCVSATVRQRHFMG
jgi:hypothetical protein